MPWFHCPLPLSFKMHQVTMLCPPHNFGTERGAWVLWVATLNKTDRGSACPRRTGNQHMGSSSLQWRSLCSISDPDLNSAPCAQEVQAELLGCVMLLPHAGNSQQLEGRLSVSCHMLPLQEGNARLLHISLSNQNTIRLETNSGKTESCSVCSPLDQRIKSNTGVLTLTERQNFSLHLCSCLLWNLWEGNGTPLQYSCLENPMHRGTW